MSAKLRDTLATILTGYLIVGLVVVLVVPGGRLPASGSTSHSPPSSPVTTVLDPRAPTPASQTAAAASPAASSPTIPESTTTVQRYGLPNTPHVQYRYTALSDPMLPLYQTEPFLNRISATGGWGSFNSSAPAPVIAVIDTGFALDHEDLQSRWDGTQGTSSWTGWDFVDNDNNPMAGRTDPNGSAVFHGTMTAGLAGLLDPRAKIMPLQALSDEGVGYTDTIAAAVQYAANNGANIISLSLGTSEDDPYLHQEIDYAISKGVLVVAAAGNNGCNCLSYPADYPEVLSVGASDQNDNLASFSSYGANLDVLAPGVDGDVCSSIYTATNATSAYSCGYSGTSFSTPIVSSLASLLLEENPGLSPPEIITTIEQNADQVAGMDGQSHTLMYGYGRVDVAKAMAAVNSADEESYGATANSTCVGFPSATCDIHLVGPGNQVVDLGQQSLGDSGAADYSWSATGLGLAAGSWQMITTLTAAGDTITLPTRTVSLSW
ncbi:MAG TPA: S8 family serine peptidase [Candidatus Saccharimonadales bacterium]|nr:S8 family serine peptidase [Candidatus Saccharimonadales bacterium]